MPGRFRAMAGALIWRESDGRYLILQRSAGRDVGALEWESVTGQLEQGESFPEAAHREVLEETGLQVRIDCILRTAHFFRGEAVPENEIVGVIYGCSTQDGATLRLSDEHIEHRWVSADEASRLFAPGDRLLRLILRAEQVRALSSDELLSLDRSDGFEF